MHPGTLPLDGEGLAHLAKQHELERPSIAVRELDSGHDSHLVGYRPDRPLYPASMIKVPLVAAALILDARGELPHTAVVDEANLTVNDGPSPLIAGYEATVDELCELAITRSDNIATNELFDLVGRERASRLVREELGLRNTGFRRKLSGDNPLVRDSAQSGRNTFPVSDAAG